MRDRPGLDFNALLIRFAMERFLFRLSVSAYREQFYLKGAMLFVLWDNNAHRPTKDLDLLFIPEHDSEQLVGIFREIAMIKVTGDGIQIDPESVQAEQIREENTYGGLRIKLICELGTIKIPLQLMLDWVTRSTLQPKSQRSLHCSISTSLEFVLTRPKLSLPKNYKRWSSSGCVIAASKITTTFTISHKSSISTVPNSVKPCSSPSNVGKQHGRTLAQSDSARRLQPNLRNKRNGRHLSAKTD